MLGLNSRRLFSPEHEGGELSTKVRNAGEIVLTCDKCLSGVPSMSTWGVYL
jgi:hypothetical protein